MPTATISVPFGELLESPQEGVNDRGPYATKRYSVAWADRFKFLQELRGNSSTTGPTGPWIRGVPYQYPDNPQLYAKEAQVQPEGDIVPGSTPLAWKTAIVTVSFGMLDWTAQQSDDPLFLNSLSQDKAENDSLQFATQELDYGREWFDVPNSSLKYKSDNKVINTPARSNFLVQKMIITWHRYPVMPMDRIKGYADCVNDKTFLGCDKGTIMLEGVNTVREMSTDGTIVQKVRMVLKWRAHDWNARVREDGFTWGIVVDKASGNEVFPYVDFSKLLLK